MGMYAKYTPIRANFDLATNLTPSNKKFGESDKGQSTAANELSQQWAVRFSTAHRFEIRRALYLTPSNKKFYSSKSQI